MQDTIDRYEPVLTIGAIASQLKIAVQTVRMYEEQGLILPVRSSTGRRMYSLGDLEKLRCIRRLINTEGLNISGIKKLMAMIPCWEFKGGLDEDCLNCQAYIQAIGPCWSSREVGAKCKGVDCRTCTVYKMNFSCNELKDLLVRKNGKKID
jgi:MerR family transcriptional regulator/heat shock protein HspR